MAAGFGRDFREESFGNKVLFIKTHLQFDDLTLAGLTDLSPYVCHVCRLVEENPALQNKNPCRSEEIPTGERKRIFEDYQSGTEVSRLSEKYGHCPRRVKAAIKEKKRGNYETIQPH